MKSFLADGNVVGFHLYPDEILDKYAYYWRDVYDELGGDWFCTELGYIRTIADPDRGWRNYIAQSEYIRRLTSDWDLPQED